MRMGAHTGISPGHVFHPLHTSELPATLLDKGDLGDLAAVYEECAVFADYDATVSGFDSITEAFRRFRDAGKTTGPRLLDVAETPT